MITTLDQRATTATKPLYKSTALLLIVEVFLLTIPFFVLGAIFDFPGILREPANVVLSRFSQNSTAIVLTYYVFAASAVATIPIALLMHKIIAAKDSVFMWIATAFGVITGIVQFLGFIRWPFLIPYLADTYQNPASSAATRDAVAVTYEAFNRYAGMAIGEHLGFIFTAIWTVMLSVAILKSPLFKAWVGWLGILLGLGVGISAIEQFSPAFEAFATVNVVAYTGWVIWLAVIAVFLLLARPDTKAING